MWSRNIPKIKDINISGRVFIRAWKISITISFNDQPIALNFQAG